VPELGAHDLESLLESLDAVAWKADVRTLAMQAASGGPMAGYGSDEWIMPGFFAAHLTDDERDVTLALCADVARDGRPRALVHRFHAADGSTRWMRTQVRRQRVDGSAELVGITRDITDLDLLHGESPELAPPTTRWMQLLLEQVPAVIWTTDRELRFTGACGAGLAVVGLRPNQLHGIHIAEYFRTDQPEHAYIAPHLRALAGETTTFETDWLGRHYRVCVEPFRRNGEIVGALALAVDDTERKQAVLRNESKRRLLEAIVDHAPVGIVLLRGPQFIIEHANPAWQAMFPGRVMKGKPAFAAWPESEAEFRPQLVRGYESRVICSDVDRVAHVQRSPGGPVEELYFSFVFVPLRDLPELPDGMLLLAVETTERVRTQRQIEEMAASARRHAAELQSIIDNIVEGIYVCDTHGRMTLVNRAGLRLLNVADAETIVGQPITAGGLAHPDGSPYQLVELPIVRALRGEVVDLEQMLLPCAPEPRHIAVTAAPIRDDADRILGGVSVARDVTELVEFEQLKDQFLRVFAHELKTPVAVMKSNAQLLLLHAASLERRRASLDAIVRGADRIDRVVRDVLDVALFHLGMEALGEERVNLIDVVRTVVAAGASESSRVTVTKTEGAVVHGDRGRLEQAVRILVDNALKYSPNGGAVEVEVAVEARRGEAIVTVSDHGIGIPAARQKRIFERFYRAHARGAYDFGGLGVGLYICREIIAHHQGHVWFESQEGVGSSFHFAIPLEHAASRDARSRSRA
jgi:PAS domain S-box-containing protein